MSATHWPWGELELSPTTDATTIRKAYAKRLKVTRPDDDAVAYQRLREAYDAALGWAARPNAQPPAVPSFGGRSFQATPTRVTFRGSDDDAKVDPTDDGFDDPVPVAHEEPSVASPPTEQEERDAWLRAVLAAPSASRDDLIGPDDVLRLRAALDALPLQSRDGVSRRFAEIAIDDHGLPEALLLEVADLFGWTHDYRQSRLVDPVRYQRLLEQIAAAERRRGRGRWLASFATTPYRFGDHAARALAFAALLEQRRAWFAALFAFFAASPLATFWSEIVAGGHRLLGIDGATPARGARFLHRAFWFQAGIPLFAYLAIKDYDPLTPYASLGYALFLAAMCVQGLRYLPLLLDHAAARATEVLFGPLQRRVKLPALAVDRVPWLVASLAALWIIAVRDVPKDVDAQAAIVIPLSIVLVLALFASRRPTATAVLLVAFLGGLEVLRDVPAAKGQAWLALAGLTYAAVVRVAAEWADRHKTQILSKLDAYWQRADNRGWAERRDAADGVVGLLLIAAFVVVAPLWILLPLFDRQGRAVGQLIGLVAIAASLARPSWHPLLIVPVAVVCVHLIQGFSDAVAHRVARRALAGSAAKREAIH